MRAVALVACVALALAVTSVDAKQHHKQQHRLQRLQQRVQQQNSKPFDEFECNRQLPREDGWRQIASLNDALARQVSEALSLDPKVAQWTEQDKGRPEYAKAAYVAALAETGKAPSATRPNPFLREAFETLDQCIWYHRLSRMPLNARELRLGKFVPVFSESPASGAPAPDEPVYAGPGAPPHPELLPTVRYDRAKARAGALTFDVTNPNAFTGVWAGVKTLKHYAAINAVPLVVQPFVPKFATTTPPATYLPALPGTCTWTISAENAVVFTTAPLTGVTGGSSGSGSSVYVARNKQSILLIHANAPADAKFPLQMMDECADRVLQLAARDRDTPVFSRYLRIDRLNPKLPPPPKTGPPPVLGKRQDTGYNPDGDAVFAVTVFGSLEPYSPIANTPRDATFEAVVVVDPTNAATANNKVFKGPGAVRRPFYPWDGMRTRGK